ncbi:glycosyltransferase family 1 protein [Prosthecochloris sp. N3]|uniref:Glycosyltransferase family 1 protein n=1 Tax=Prosthecochloris ethylica TaxID=2743976 RepID=A0ABR9XP47_9CHLB|nr:glycosyltransferase family 1 protein [Prosthecochloris ethylica]MBF0585732.1 glycosyltransferase family 1 protein [Prosthecochloris ethylica]MBF0635642.1 glycosyltransferase family 1 protein [Prosthecochloris ethylica]NUK46941.1 glycosyltransferase family 1 protein [Prosthecochloris ethylica]
MKIAFYGGTYVRNKDGAVRSMYQLVSSLLADGHEVMVWSPDVSEGGCGGEQVNRMPSVPIPLYTDYRLGFYSASTSRQLDAFGPDIIHISTPDIIGYNFLKYGLKHGLPVGSVYHTDFPSYLKYYRLGFTEPLVWAYLRKFYNACDVVFVPTQDMKHRLEENGVTTVGIWSRGIDAILFNPSSRSESLRRSWGAEDRMVIAYAGRFVWYKDIRVVMEVYDRFMKGPDASKVTFVMIGSGPEEEELKRRMPGAVFPGYLSGRELSEAYASSDLFLFPSTTESFGNVVLEAFASGLPAVVSDEGGCKELVGEAEAGFIEPAGETDAFYRSCTRLIHDRALYLEQRKRALAYAESRSWPVINGALIARYRDLITARRGDG